MRVGSTVRSAFAVVALACPLTSNAATYTASTSAQAYNSFAGQAPAATTGGQSNAIGATSSSQQAPTATTSATGTATANMTGLKAVATADAGAFGFRAFAGSASLFASSYGASATESTAGLLFTSNDVTATTVTTSLNLDLDGSISSFYPAGGGGGAQALVAVRVLVRDADGNVKTDQTARFLRSSDANATTNQTQGFFVSGYDGVSAITLHTAAFAVPVGMPLTLDVTLGTAAQTDNSSFAASSAKADYFHTLTFAKSGQVFALGAGQSATAADVGIVGNRFVAVAPEPIGVAFVAPLAALLRRRRGCVARA